MSDTHPTCSTCRHWRPGDTRESPGECRRHAPRPIMLAGSVATPWPWPPTLADQWCGEWAPSPVAGQGARPCAGCLQMRAELGEMAVARERVLAERDTLASDLEASRGEVERLRALLSRRAEVD